MSKAVTISPLRISTMTVTAKWGLPIQLDVLFDQLKKHLIPIGYYGAGVLKIEHKGQVFGACYKDLFTNRKATEDSFYNQSTVVIRQPFSGGWKELNMKLFSIGSIQMTGVTDQDFAVKTVEWLLAFIETLPQSPFAGKAAVTDVDISLINTDYSLSHNIQQDNLHKLFLERYNLFSMLE